MVVTANFKEIAPDNYRRKDGFRVTCGKVWVSIYRNNLEMLMNIWIS